MVVTIYQAMMGSLVHIVVITTGNTSVYVLYALHDVMLRRFVGG